MSKISEWYKQMTEENLLEILKEMYDQMPNEERGFKIGQGCKTNGFVIREVHDLKICEDETCSSCQSFAKSFDQGMKEYVRHLPKFDEEE